jgi:hypothetical protein
MLDAAGNGLTFENNPTSIDLTLDQDDGDVPLPDYFRAVRRLLLAAPTPTELPLQAQLHPPSNNKPELTRVGKVIGVLLLI